jgi:cytochrome c peroxidase
MKLRSVVLLALISLGCDKAAEKQPTKEAAPSALPTAAPSLTALAPSASADTSAPAPPPRPIATSLEKVPVPDENPLTDAKIKLGHLLFFDKRLSVDGSRSCYSCHQNEDGTGGHEPLAIGAGGKPLTRHSPALWNVGFLPALYWDGRAATLEEQATGAWAGPNMGVGKEKLAEKAAEIGAIPGYKKLFDEAFPGKGATPETIVQAIASYERTLVCNDTAYDRYMKGDQKALTDVQKRGLEIFNGKAGCVACHTPPFFSIAYMTPTGTYFNVGIGIQGKKEEEVDVGRMAVTKKDTDWAAFKPPTLRNISKTAPYFHDGSVEKLEDAVRAMSNGGYANKNLTPIMTNKELTDREVSDIVAFLKALDCNQKLEVPKKLP